MNITIYTDDPGDGGVAVYNHRLALGLRKLGHEITLVQSKATQLSVENLVTKGIRLIEIPFNTRADQHRNLTDVKLAGELLAEAKPEIIVFSNCSQYSHIAAANAALELQLPYIIVEGYVAPYKALDANAAWCILQLEKQFAAAKAVIAVSMENLEVLRRQYRLHTSHGEVIHYGRPDEYFASVESSQRSKYREEFGIDEQDVLCLTTARYAAVKGYSHQIAAIKRLCEIGKIGRLKFLWAGSGPELESISKQVAAHGLEGIVNLCGFREDVAGLLDAADMYVLPSHYEGMPLSIMEAMAKGLPVIASRVSGIPEMLGSDGSAGILLPDPKADANATEVTLADALDQLAGDAEKRNALGAAARLRAESLFREERMIDQTLNVIERALLPKGDYASPGLRMIRLDSCFPNLAVGDPTKHDWPYLRSEIKHRWLCDRRMPTTGFLSRDEAILLYNLALPFAGKRALEIGCWMGWSACHLAAAGVLLDVVDPVLARPEFMQSVSDSLRRAPNIKKVNLVPGFSPNCISQVASGGKWSFFFIDGNHDSPYPVYDAAVCAEYAENDALIVFHDLSSPEVAQGLGYLKERGWQTLIYNTMQIMGVAWRGNAVPVTHRPDPLVFWQMPRHLVSYRSDLSS